MNSRDDHEHDPHSQAPSTIIASDRAPAFSRRALLKGASAGPVVLLAASCATSEAPAPPAAPLDAGRRAVLDAFAERIIPADANGPGARDAGVVRYIERSLADWNRSDLPLVTGALDALERAAQARNGSGFAALAGNLQDELMLAMEQGRLETLPESQPIFNRLHRLTLEGMFSDPYWGGNAGYAGWDLIGYPGAVLGSTVEMQQMNGRQPPLHTSAYGAEHDGH